MHRVAARDQRYAATIVIELAPLRPTTDVFVDADWTRPAARGGFRELDVTIVRPRFEVGELRDRLTALLATLRGEPGAGR